MSKAILNEHNHLGSHLKQKHHRNPEIEKVKGALAEALDENDEVTQFLIIAQASSHPSGGSSHRITKTKRGERLQD